MWHSLRGLLRVFKLVGIVAAAALVFAIGLRALRQSPPPKPLQVSLWDWHQPFRLPADEAAMLHEAGVTTLFVRAGTIARDQDTGDLRLVLPQTWASRADGFAIHLVFNADYSVVRSLDRISDSSLQNAFAAAIRRERVRAVAAGIAVAGIQLDFDYPTRLLPRYALLLHALRADRTVVEPKDAFSITALPTWLTSRDLPAVAAQVDFIAPQFYEAVVPRTLTTFATISDESRLRRGLARAGRLGTPFWAGLPSYGHALVFDGKGRLRGAFHDAGVLDMARQPYFHIDRVYPADRHGAPAATSSDFTGENIVELGPTGVGVPDQTNFHLIYDLPTPTLVARQLACVAMNRPSNCAGVILYRYPERFPTEAVPLRSLLSVLKGKTPAPHLKVLVYSRPYAPWRGIEGGEDAGGPSRNVFVSVTNDGDGPAGVARDAVDVAVRFDRAACLREIAPGGFDVALPFASTPDDRASIARADGVRLTSLHLAPGESLIAGPLRIAADAAVANVAWRVTGDGGFAAYHGEVDLKSHTKDVRR